MLSEKEVLKIASLAKLKLSEAEITKYGNELASILDYVSKLNELNLEGTEATSHAVQVTNVFREDAVQKNNVADQVIKTAPQSEDHFFCVPKVI